VKRIAAMAAVVLALAGCGSAAGSASRPVVIAPLTTSMSTAGATWAVVVMGGSAASENNFWQLFVRTSARWSLVTPPGVADNGGLVAAGGSSLLVGFRPSQGLAFSPLATTDDHGTKWTPALLNATLADVPDALAVAPDGGRTLALLDTKTMEQASPAATGWSVLSRVASVAASPAGKSCGLSAITAVSFTPSGVPLAGGACDRAGAASVFSYSGGTWHAAGPALPGRTVQVLRLTATSTGNAALLLSGTSLYAAWTSGAGWTVSAPLTASLSSAAFGPGGSVGVLLSGGRVATISGPGAAWTLLPKAPAGSAVLALDPVQALSVSGGSKLTVWRLAGTWTKEQVINVPIGYGTSS
jgi:hypothetical protein